MGASFLASDKWQTILASLVNSVGDSQFCRLLAEACQEVAGYESSVISQFAEGKMPAWVFENLQPEVSSHYRRNLAAEYLLDPYYALYESRSPGGIYRLEDIAPDNFFQSELYNKYYEPSGLLDETGVFVRLSDDRYLLLDMGNRSTPKAKTSRIERLKSIFPIIEALCRKHDQFVFERQQGQLAQQEGSSEALMGAPLNRAFYNFGKDHLSNRECEVIQLTLKGHSIKSIARLLDISIDTVKVYNKRFHSKLDISSQAELFSLFLEAISMIPVNSDQDPLSHYLALTKKQAIR